VKMNFLVKHSIGIVTVTTIFIGCLLLFLFSLASKSIQQQQVEVSHIGILEAKGSIKIDRYGIPYIYGSSEQDVHFLLGLSHAKDRLFQMDFLRRAGRGNLTEILGSSYIQSDKFAKTIQLRTFAQLLSKNCSDSIRTLLTSYSKGVNYFIQTNKNSLSIEFDNLGYIPEEWSIEDSYLLWKLHTLESDVSFWASLTASELQYVLGEEYAKELLPFNIKDNSIDTDTIVIKLSPTALLISITNDSLYYLPYIPRFKYSTTIESTKKNTDQSFDSFSKQSKSFRQVLGWENSKSACATWSYFSNNDTSKSLIFVADIHSTLQLPSKWFICTLILNDKVLSGATIPGIPFIINGRNTNVSWAFTSYSVDQTDYFIEVLNDNATSCTKNNFESVPIVYTIDTIIQKNEEPLFFRRRTINGLPILSDWFPKDSSWIQKSSKPKKSLYSEYVISVKSLFFDTIVDPFSALYAVSNSVNATECRKILQNWKYPAQMFHSSDKYFKTELLPIGAVPIRNAECVFTFTNPGWNDNRFGWSGKFELLQNTEVKNAIKNVQYKIGTNMENSFTNGKQFPGWYDPYFRFKRISTLLNSYREYSIREAQFMLNDVTSYYAQEMNYELKRLYKTFEKELTNVEKNDIETLLKWEGIYSVNDSISNLYSIYVETVNEQLYEDDLGKYYYSEYKTIPSVQGTKTLLVLRDTLESKWTGTISKQDFRKKKDFMVQVVKLTSKRYRNELKNSTKKGSTVTFQYLTEAIPSIRLLSTIGPFDYKGDEYTIQSFEKNTLLESKPKVSSFRFITNLLENYYLCVIPGGISGEPLDVHYADQIQLWLNGGYCKVYVTNQYLQNLTTTYNFY